MPTPLTAHHPTQGLRYLATHRLAREALAASAAFWALFGVLAAGLLALPSHGVRLPIAFALFCVGVVAGWVGLTVIRPACRNAWLISWSLVTGGLGLVLVSPAIGPNASGALADTWRGLLLVLVGFALVALKIAADDLHRRVTRTSTRAWQLAIGGVRIVADLTALAVGFAWVHTWPGWTGLLIAVAGAAAIAGGVGTVLLRHARSPDRLSLAQFLCLHAFQFYTAWWHRAKIHGRLRAPRNRPLILVSNHISPVDPLLLHYSIGTRAPSWFVAREQYETRGFHYVCSLWNCIPVNRDGQETAAVKAALRWLQDGGAMGIFPEGGIPDPTEYRAPKTGAATLALRVGAVIQPAAVWGIPPSAVTLAPLWRRGHIELRFGTPIDVARDYAGREKDPAAVDELTARLWQAVQDLLPPSALARSSDRP